MELLVWHEALGCDDEQASESELLARVLYAYTSSESDGVGDNNDGNDTRKQLQSMHFVQGLLAFVRMLKRNASNNDTPATPQQPPRKCLEWASVVLSRRRFFIQEVEPQIYFALGIAQTTDLREHRFVYRSLLRDLYDTFCLFHGRIEQNLRQLIGSSDTATMSYADGMELLLATQAARKRIRKLELLLETAQHDRSSVASDCATSNDGSDATIDRLCADRACAQHTLDALLAVSPAARVARYCASLFPLLLQTLDATHVNSLHELVGVRRMRLPSPAFLALQSFVNALILELGPGAVSNDPSSSATSTNDLDLNDRGVVAASALFFKGNLVWSSIDGRPLALLYRFLRLREEHGMQLAAVASDCRNTRASTPRLTSTTDSVWMADAYRDTFRPIWSSRTAYVECAIVTHARRHPRKSVRSLHRQVPLSLAAVVTDANTSPALSSSSSSSTTQTSVTSVRGDAYTSRTGDASGTGAHASTQPLRLLSKTALKARLKAVAYRNTGLLMSNGYFAKTFELPMASRNRGKFSDVEAVDFIWKPRVFTDALSGASSSKRSDKDDDAQPERARYAVLWHESDLSMLLLVNDDSKLSGSESSDTAAAAQVLATLARIEDAIDRLQLHALAKLLHSQRSSSTSSSSSSSNSTYSSNNSHKPAAYPFVYVNRADASFETQQVPRLLKSKDTANDDAYPLPLRLLAHYLSQQTLALLNTLHSEVHKSGGPSDTRDVCVKTLRDGWVLAKKARCTQREFYAFFDTKVPSVADLSDALEELLQDQFGNVFF